VLGGFQIISPFLGDRYTVGEPFDYQLTEDENL
jgi:hypothetical protein